MRAQVASQGRNLGDRPPYGYRLVDAGPHPNKAHARWGRRALRLDPDPATAPHVEWMFAQRLAGRSITAIARELNERGVPCPSQVDIERNRHRTGRAWIWQTVAAILANPRYTGRQTWNRQRTDTGSLDATDDVLGRAEARRWNSLQDWVVSEQVAHPPLVSEADFVAAQAIYATPTPADGSMRGFALTGLLFCQLCGRRLCGHWVHSRAGYRCRHGHTSAQVAEQDRRRNVYVRQDQVLMFLATHVPQLRQLDDERRLVLAAFQSVHELTVVCTNYTWRMEIDGITVFDGWPPQLPRREIPRQPRRSQMPT
jgi:site-specific DNA recombinase